MGGKRGGLLVLSFTANREEDGGYIIYTCNEAPVVGSGKTEDDAYADMYAALLVYVKTLGDRGELEAVLEGGTIPFIRISSGDLVAVDIRCSVKPQLAHRASDTWLVPTQPAAQGDAQTAIVMMANR